jgi:hypothetical protein
MYKYRLKMKTKDKITITLDSKLWEQYKKYCVDNDLKYSTKLERLIKDYLFNGEEQDDN